jgi:uncharacterized protein
MSTHERFEDPFHAGEIAIQELAGERELAIRLGGILAPSVMARALPFLQAQRTLAVGAADDEGRPWASLFIGPPGFVSSADGRVVRIERRLAAIPDTDPVLAGLVPGRAVGLLAIELSTRKRLRINGVLQSVDDSFLDVVVQEAFPNCPKYIQRREVTLGAAGAGAVSLAEGSELGPAQHALVERVDTAFVASRHPERGADVSHRGGEPGFIRVLGPRTLRLPDYPGNSMFQTLGNLWVEPRAGLLLVDFSGRRVLSLTGRARIDFGTEQPSHTSGGTGRYWELELSHFRELALAAGVVPGSFEPSPFNPSPVRE